MSEPLMVPVFSEKGKEMIARYREQEQIFFDSARLTTIDASAFQKLELDPSYFPGFDPTLKGAKLALNCIGVVMKLAQNEDIDRFYRFLALMYFNKNDRAY